MLNKLLEIYKDFKRNRAFARGLIGQSEITQFEAL